MDVRDCPHEDGQPVRKRRLLTEADVPPLPSLLPKNATEAEKADRKRKVAERRKVKKQLQEQQRGPRDRADRVRPDAEAERVRRAVQRLEADAGSRPLLPTKNTFSELWALTESFHSGPPTTAQGRLLRQEKVDAAWERLLGRKMPMTGVLVSEEDGRFVCALPPPPCYPVLRVGTLPQTLLPSLSTHLSFRRACRCALPKKKLRTTNMVEPTAEECSSLANGTAKLSCSRARSATAS